MFSRFHTYRWRYIVHTIADCIVSGLATLSRKQENRVKRIVVDLEKNCWQFSFSFRMHTPGFSLVQVTFKRGERVARERKRERERPDLDGSVRGSREHEDADRRLCHSQNGHDADVSVESAVVTQTGSVVHLYVLAVGSRHQELAGHPQRVDGPETRLYLFDKAEIIAGSPDVESVVCGAVQVVLRLVRAGRGE